MYKIVKKDFLSDNIFMTDVHAPRVSDKCLPGQFVIVRTDKNGERIPLTICDYSRENGTVRLVVQIIGATTLKMSRLSVGDCLEDIVGPLIHQKRTNALENAILSIQKYLPGNCSKQEIIICVKQHDEDLKEYKKLLIMQTPYRLLSSFLVDVGGNDPIWNRPKDIIETIKDYNEKYRLPYIIENDRGLKRKVIVQPEWRDFLMTNYRVIMEWVHDEKIKYLEKRKIEESAS